MKKMPVMSTVLWHLQGVPQECKVSDVNLMSFSKAQCKVLHMGQGNPQYQYRAALPRRTWGYWWMKIWT